MRPGNAGRGVVRGPGFENWDLSLKKNFALGERFNLQLRGESFNLLNHPNPNGFGSTNITSSLVRPDHHVPRPAAHSDRGEADFLKEEDCTEFEQNLLCSAAD